MSGRRKGRGQKPRPGRPPTGHVNQFLKLTPVIKQRLHDEASNSGRTISETAERILAEKFREIDAETVLDAEQKDA